MYQNYQTPYSYNNYQYGYQSRNGKDDRLFGGFAVPFILGGIAGSAFANNNQGYYYPYPVYNNYYYPYYSPYYY